MEIIDFYASAASFFFSLLMLWSGIGAGLLVVPVLIALLNTDPLVAIASGSMFAFISKMLMTFVHSQQGNVDWRLVYMFLRICLPVTLINAAFLAYLSESKHHTSLELYLIIGILLVGCLALAALLSDSIKEILAKWPLSSMSGTTGVLMGLTGVGGGVLVVPALATRGGLTIKTAIATSIPIGLTLSLAVSLTLGSRGLVDYQLVISLLIGTVIAIPVGVRLFHLFSDNVINRITCTLIGLALVGLLVKATNLASHL
tara:strand:- start:797 stop:1570 length:774 start_codon:yes stop_codon:yes gene_type:complete